LLRSKLDLEKIIIIAIVTTFMGQIYISPIPGYFRLSMAVLTLSILLIHFNQVPVMLVCSLIAVLTPLFRTFVNYTTYQDATFLQVFSNYYPVAIYYLL
jgi:two-component system sensor histidine kinase YcbA